MARRKKGSPFDPVKHGSISDDEITNFLSQKYRIPTIDLTEYVIEPTIIAIVSAELCREHSVLPVSRTGQSLIVAMADPTNLYAIEALKSVTGYTIEPVIATEKAILDAIGTFYGRPTESS